MAASVNSRGTPRPEANRAEANRREPAGLRPTGRAIVRGERTGPSYRGSARTGRATAVLLTRAACGGFQQHARAHRRSRDSICRHVFRTREHRTEIFTSLRAIPLSDCTRVTRHDLVHFSATAKNLRRTVGRCAVPRPGMLGRLFWGPRAFFYTPEKPKKSPAGRFAQRPTRARRRADPGRHHTSGRF
jgi:hypothetical protein